MNTMRQTWKFDVVRRLLCAVVIVVAAASMAAAQPSSAMWPSQPTQPVAGGAAWPAPVLPAERLAPAPAAPAVSSSLAAPPLSLGTPPQATPIAQLPIAASPVASPAAPQTVMPAAAYQPESSRNGGYPTLNQPGMEFVPEEDYFEDTQGDAPGADTYGPDDRTRALPDYLYEPEYYNTPGIGARPLADYAPPGYEPREFQDAPGAAEFTPIPVPVRVTEAERDKFVVPGLYPGSWLVPGTNTSFRLRGFVRLAGLYDLDPIGSRDDFVTNTIPVPQEDGENTNFSARYSRFALETWTPTEFYDWNVHTFIEGDFFNGPAQAVGGGGNPFRLRFAFVDFGYFRLGQQNTVFMDSSAFPSTVDFAGPRGLANLRRASARMTLPLCETIYWATGIEQPFSDITTSGLGVNVQEVPDFATHLRYQGDYGSLQISGLARSIGYRPFGGAVTNETGFGISESLIFHPWAIMLGCNPVRIENPSGLVRSRILLQHTMGEGVARYIQDTAGLGLDGQVDPATGAFNLVDVTGWSASYEHWFDSQWLSNLTYSVADADNNGGQPGTTYAEGNYFAWSLWYIPVPNMSIGVEYLWGERANFDGQSADAQRLNALFQYNF